MKEDILEQMVDEYYRRLGYFTRHNIKFKPKETHPDFDKRQDSVHSDIDVVGVHPKKRGLDKVVAVSCKSWQAGFNPKAKIKEIEASKRVNGRDAWRGFRELANAKWGAAFVDKMEEICGARKFTYVTAVTKLKGEKDAWENCRRFRENLGGNPIKTLTFEEMLDELWPDIKTTTASSELGRILQLVKASGWQPRA